MIMKKIFIIFAGITSAVFMLTSSIAETALKDASGFKCKNSFSEHNFLCSDTTMCFEQSGCGNSVSLYIEKDSLKLENGNIPGVSQCGKGNNASIEISGESNISEITQTGDSNNVSVEQSGSNHKSVIKQTGNGNSVSIRQSK
jgi:hypothetical protein